MMLVSLARGMVAVVDAADYPLVEPYSWCPTGAGGMGTYYARAHRIGTKRNVPHILMHRLILGVADVSRAVVVDHINGDGLDNRRENLRLATHRLNCANRIFRKSASGFKGVSQHGNGWRARIGSGADRCIGQYQSPEDAAMAYDDAARAIFGKFARLNFPRAGEVAA